MGKPEPTPIPLESGQTIILPHVLDFDGEPRSSSIPEWRNRRDALLSTFAATMYGRLSVHDVAFHIERQESGPSLGGLAERMQYRVRWSTAHGALSADVLVYLPLGRPEPVPAFVGLNFCGNSGITNDPYVWLSTAWHRDDPENGFVDGHATEASRGSSIRRWPLAEIIARGYAVVTCYYGDVDPDFDDGFENGAHALEAPDDRGRAGAIAAWSWGLCRVLDLVETIPEIDSKAVVCVGHSRLGKAALWAAAMDERFAAAVSNESGCGGAALSRRDVGESIASITTEYPHWFAPSFADHAERIDDLPFDQHHLLALIAPRPVYVASAAEDVWADPDGEFLAARLASPAYELYGLPGMYAEAPPAPGVSVGGRIGYHRRAGKHDMLAEDWRHILDFADRELS